MVSSLTRSQVTTLIARDLARRWLGSSSLIARRLRRITRSRARWIDQLAESIYLQFGNSGQRVLGLNVNTQLSTDRTNFETLKAILTNCRRYGWRSQNREQHVQFRLHLQGRIAHVGQTNPNRCQKLIKLFDAIDWA